MGEFQPRLKSIIKRWKSNDSLLAERRSQRVNERPVVANDCRLLCGHTSETFVDRKCRSWEEKVRVESDGSRASTPRRQHSSRKYQLLL